MLMQILSKYLSQYYGIEEIKVKNYLIRSLPNAVIQNNDIMNRPSTSQQIKG